MKKFLSFILAGVLLATPSLHANVKVHFEGDITKTTLYNLPSWIEPVFMQEAEWLIKVKEGRARNFLGCAMLSSGIIAAGSSVIIYRLTKLPEEEDQTALVAATGGTLGGLLMGVLLSRLPIWSNISYSLDIRNLQTGEHEKSRIWSFGPAVSSDFLLKEEEDSNILQRGRKKLARKLAKFFEKYNKDRRPPQLALSPPFDLREFTTPEEKVTMRFSVTDDVELGRVVIQKDGRTYREYSAAGGKRFTKSLEIPLELGYNKFRILAYDWMNKAIMTEEIAIFRSKEGGEPPRRPEPPELSVKVTSTNQTNTLMGGTMGGIIVTIHNSGKGYADNVKVRLSGDQQLWAMQRRSRRLRRATRQWFSSGVGCPTILSKSRHGSRCW